MSLQKIKTQMSRTDGLLRMYTQENVDSLQQSVHFHIVYKKKQAASGILPMLFFGMMWLLMLFLPILDCGERTTSVVAFRADWTVPPTVNTPVILSITVECLIFWLGGFCLSSVFLHRALSSSRQPVIMICSLLIHALGIPSIVSRFDIQLATWQHIVVAVLGYYLLSRFFGGNRSRNQPYSVFWYSWKIFRSNWRLLSAEFIINVVFSICCLFIVIHSLDVRRRNLVRARYFAHTTDAITVFLCTGTLARMMCEPRGSQAVAFQRQLDDLKVCFSSLLRVSFASPWLWCIASAARVMSRLRRSLLSSRNNDMMNVSIIPFQTELAFFLYGAVACCLSIFDFLVLLARNVLHFRSPTKIGVFGDCDYRRVDYMAKAFQGQKEIEKTFIVPGQQVFLIFMATWLPCVLLIGSVIISLVERPYLLVYIPIIVGLQLRLRLSLLVESAKACLLIVQADNSIASKMNTPDRSYGSLIDRCIEELQKGDASEEDDDENDFRDTDDQGSVKQGMPVETENDESDVEDLNEAKQAQDQGVSL